MVLESLLELVERLRARIDEHGASLRQSEALTRYALIDPLLRELGWDTEDPALVIPEYRLGRSYADYALLSNGMPMIMVEAKKLGEPLENHRSQGIGYCIEDGIAYFAVTDGSRWEIYETHKVARIDEKMIVHFELSNAAASECLKALALWRPSAIEGSISPGQSPLISTGSRVATPSERTSLPQPQQKVEREPVSQSSVASADVSLGWIPLSELVPLPRSKPSEVMLPDSTYKHTSTWASVTAEIVRWLWGKGLLNGNHLPIPIGRSRYLLTDEPIHRSGRAFANAVSVGPLYLEANYSAPNHANNARFIIERVGLNPADFKVHLA